MDKVGAQSVQERRCGQKNKTQNREPKGLDANGVDLGPLDKLPKKAFVMNNAVPLKTRLEFMPKNALQSRDETLHVWRIPADELANEGVVLQLDFEKGAVDEAISKLADKAK